MPTEPINLINLFTFYLATVFVINTYRRIRQYGDISQIVFSAPGRWPNVLKQLKKHGVMFFTWTTLRPAALAVLLMAIQMICSRVLYPNAVLAIRDIIREWWMWPALLLTGVGMIAVDLYFIIRVGAFDRMETFRYLDEAEHWLTSWKAPLVSVVTLGFVNPRRMVDDAVQLAVAQGSTLLQRTLWWVSLQTGLRVAFGLSLWLSWALLPMSK
ncbi:MAG: hypothetical protein R3B84_12070 [Zavarzinella sp.]